MHNDKEKKCALCESLMATNSELSICSVCLGYADCCVGLESCLIEYNAYSTIFNVSVTVIIPMTSPLSPTRTHFANLTKGTRL